MSSDESNPYASPVSEPNVPDNLSREALKPEALKKVEAIIKDAGQFWIAILICVFCSLMGSLIIGPWYLVRFMQWKKMSQENPSLLAPNPPPGSLPQRFQSAKGKLIAGMVAGVIMVGLAMLYLVAIAVAAANV